MTGQPDDWYVDYPDDAMVLIGCSGSKLSSPAPARDFYTGDLFRASVRWAESWGFAWRVLSALHGLIEPDAVVSYYDVRLTGGSDAARTALLRSQLPPGVRSVVVLAGRCYVEEAQTAWPELLLWAPLQELPDRGIGHYKAWLRRNTAVGAA